MRDVDSQQVAHTHVKGKARACYRGFETETDKRTVNMFPFPSLPAYDSPFSYIFPRGACLVFFFNIGKTAKGDHCPVKFGLAGQNIKTDRVTRVTAFHIPWTCFIIALHFREEEENQGKDWNLVKM